MLFQPAKTTISDGSLVTPGVPTPMVRSGARARSQRMETSTLWRTAGCSESFFGGISPLFLKRLRLRSFEVAMEKFPPSYTLEKALLPRHLGQTLLPKQMPCYPSDEKPWSLSLQGWQTQYQIAVVKSDTWVYFHKLLFHTIPITYLPFRSLCLACEGSFPSSGMSWDRYHEELQWAKGSKACAIGGYPILAQKRESTQILFRIRWYPSTHWYQIGANVRTYQI